MKNLYSKQTHSGVFKKLSFFLLGLIVLANMGCKTGSPGSSDGVIINTTSLPTNLALNLKCADVGVNTETCILDDDENPFRYTIINEFDINDPDDLVSPFENKFALSIEAEVAGAKAEFYLWATALAKLQVGENQYYAARALHKLYSAQVAAGFGDPIIREQALKAYKSVLDNFFNDPTFFSNCSFPGVFCPPLGTDPEFIFAVLVRDLTGKSLVVAEPPDYIHLFPGFTPVTQAQDLMASWGYGYDVAFDETFRFFPGSP